MKQIFSIEQTLALAASQLDALKEALGLGQVDQIACSHPNVMNLSTMGSPHTYCPDCGFEQKGKE